MSDIMYKREKLSYFDEQYFYKSYALVNEIYEDEDHRANTWMWGKVDGEAVVDVKLLRKLSSNSYAPWDEVKKVFHETVDLMMEK